MWLAGRRRTATQLVTGLLFYVWAFVFIRFIPEKK
jgi:hypothetical protein